MNYINQIVKWTSDQINGKYRTHADALSAVNADPQSLRYVSKYLRNNREIVMAAVNGKTSIPLGISILKYASDDLRNDPEVVLAAVKKNPFELRYASSELRNDKDLVLEAVGRFGWALTFASSELRNDRDLVLEAILNLRNTDFLSKFTRWMFITFIIGKNLKNQRDFIVDMLEIDVLFLKYVSHEFKNDRTIVLQLMAEKCGRFYYYTDELYENFDAFQYASKQLKHDRSFIIDAIKLDGLCIEHLSNEFQNDRAIVLDAIAQNCCAFQYASADLRNDPEVVLAAVTSVGNWYESALKYTSEVLQADKEIVMAVVKQNGYALEYASDELKADRDVVTVAVSRDGCALEFASNDLRNDPKVVIAAVKKDVRALRYVSYHLMHDKEVVMAVVKQSGIALAYVSDELRDDPEVVLAAIKECGSALQYASKALRKDKEFVLQAMQQNIKSGWYSSLTYKDRQWVLELPAQAVIENKREAESRILGCVGMFVDQMRRDCGLLKKDYESIDTNYPHYYEHIVSYTSVRDIGLLSQLSTNRYVEDVSEAGKMIKRSPRRENEHKNDDGLTFASITKKDSKKGVKKFVNRDDYPDTLRRLNYDR